MNTTAPYLTLPRPTSFYRGGLADAWGVMRTGRLGSAWRVLVAVDPTTLEPTQRAQHGTLLLTCQLAVGEVDAASGTAAALAALPEVDAGAVTAIQLAQGELATALGDHETALRHFEAAGTSAGADDPDLEPWRSGAAVASVRTGDRTRAVELAREELSHAEESVDLHRLAVSLRTLGTVDPSVDPIRTLQRALGLARHTDDLRLIAQISTDLAGLMLLTSNEAGRDELLELLRPAEAFAATEGLRPLQGRVSRLLERVAPDGDGGGDGAAVGVPALEQLTSAEQRVARLAANGMSNREIAHQLAVTVKGVEWHLSRVYRKLGIGSRTSLGSMLDAG
ncbi:helix-turn-helix transcriptional regulator [Nocardioides sp. Kera G14]|uniref:helix-turn-helix transcriptional regulator n=1 Tax=Nocardioides sp. Kera G14 TaxID=2884264 RepID=UPI001D10E037|nr:LuxR C-terminal-related transcriptional regulator [Nocardioides sp. Kera G14]UDY23517.1 LuxR C-terminal-related transcriptional regulator [Nocardioides sp. Kera G14]